MSKTGHAIIGRVGAMERHGFAVPAGSGRVLPAAGGRLLASASDTHGAYSLLLSHAPTGDQVPLHVHKEVDEAFFVLAGRYRITCGDDTWQAKAHDFVYLPRNVPHAYEVTEGPAAKLILAAPGGIERLFEDLDAGVSPDELTHRHGVRFIPTTPHLPTPTHPTSVAVVNHEDIDERPT